MAKKQKVPVTPSESSEKAELSEMGEEGEFEMDEEYGEEE